MTGAGEPSAQAPRLAVLLQGLRAAPEQPARALLGRCERAALDAALRLRTRLGGTLAAVALGPAAREDPVLAAARAAGCDRAVRVHAPGCEDLDSLGVATVLGAAVAALGCDLVLCGDRGEDPGTGAVGPAVAEVLGIPHLTGVIDVDAGAAPAAAESPRSVQVAHRSGGRIHRFCWRLPAAFCMLAPAAAPDHTADDAAGQEADQEGDHVADQEAEEDRAAAPDTFIETLTLDALGLDAGALAHHRLPGNAPTDPGARALLADSAVELVARLVSGGVLR